MKDIYGIEIMSWVLSKGSVITPLQGLAVIVILLAGLHPAVIYYALSGLSPVKKIYLMWVLIYFKEDICVKNSFFAFYRADG